MDEETRQAMVNAVRNIDSSSREDILEVVVRLCAGILGVASAPNGIRTMNNDTMENLASMMQTAAVMLMYFADKNGYRIDQVCDLVRVAIQDACASSMDNTEQPDGE